MDDLQFYYFAYGSNLPYLRMLDRTSNDLRLRGKFAWQGRRLLFSKISSDGSGKCTVQTAPEDQVVWGAIYQLSAADRQRLAKCEAGYHEVSFTFPIDGVPTVGYTYVADSERIDLSLRPYEWYKRFVLAGAREHGFPAEYVVAIEGVTAIRDPDAKRSASYEPLLIQVENAPQSWTPKF